MFIDELTIEVHGGRGGDGAATFFPGYKTGPSGGDGGKGGDVYIQSNPNLSDLHPLSGVSVYKAQNGTRGANFTRNGAKGDDLILAVPSGTAVINAATGDLIIELNGTDSYRFARGGKGGKGNPHFVTSTNRSPQKAERGTVGEEKNITLIVRLIADCGFIGLPNAGKSSLLNALTSAGVKTGAYPFTTKEASLGACGKTIIADIPGLIEHASKGKGLGIRFLKHIEKVAHLFHCISCENTDPLQTYHVIRKELEQYNPALLEKPETILLTKTDVLNSKEVETIVKTLGSLGRKIVPVSIYDDASLSHLAKLLPPHQSG